MIMILKCFLKFLLIFIIFFIHLTGISYLHTVNCEVCYAGESRHKQRSSSWLLTPLDPCFCTSLRYPDEKYGHLITDDINAIRKYLQVTCPGV